MVELDVLLRYPHVEHPQPLGRPRPLKVGGGRRQVHLLERAPGARDAHEVVPVGAPLDLQIRIAMHEERRLAPQKTHQRVGLERNLGEPRDVARARGPLVEFSLAHVHEREVSVVSRQGRDDRVEGWRAQEVEPKPARTARKEQHLAADPTLLGERIDLGFAFHAAFALVGRLHSRQGGGGVRKLRRRRRNAVTAHGERSQHCQPQSCRYRRDRRGAFHSSSFRTCRIARPFLTTLVTASLTPRCDSSLGLAKRAAETSVPGVGTWAGSMGVQRWSWIT